MASNGITARRSFHRIWIAGKKSLVKRALGWHQTALYQIQVHLQKRIAWMCSDDAGHSGGGVGGDLQYRQVSNISAPNPNT